MQAVILAAGNSSRFYPYNQTFEHKALLPIMGKTILEHTILSVQSAGVDDIIIVTRKDSVIPNLLGNGEKFGVHIFYKEHDGAHGMGAALLEAKDLITDTFFLLNAYHIDFADFAKEMIDAQKENNAVMLGRKEINSSAFGYMTITNEKVTGIIEKPRTFSEDMLRIIGIYLLPKNFLTTLSDTPSSHYHFEEALDIFVKNETVTFVKTSKFSLTLKYVTDLFAMKDYLLGTIKEQNVSSRATIAQSVEIIGNVIVADGATVMEGVCIKGPAYIGKDVTVGNRAIIRNGVSVEEGATIGSQLEVKNSLIMNGTTTHSGFIGDSIVGSETKIAAQIVTANARLDRQSVAITVKDERISSGLRHLGMIVGSHANVGIRVSTMPGVIIGNNAIIGPATTVMKDVADDMTYYTKFQEIIEKKHEK